MKSLSIIIISILLLLSQNIYSQINKRVYHAIKSNNMKKIKHLINKKNVNKIDSNGENILNYAIINKNLKIVKYLIKLGINLNNKSKISYDFIIKNGKIKSSIKVLEDNGKLKHGDTPLIIAIKVGNERIIKLLISKGAIINLENNGSNTPLNASIKTNNIKLVKYLIKKKVNLNPKYSSWNTPLILAIEKNNLDMVKLLIKNSVNISQLNANHISPLKYSVMTNNFSKKRFKIVKYLIKKGAKIENDVIYTAINTKSPDLIEFLLNNNAKLTKNGKFGETEFEKASEMGELKILKKLFSIRKTQYLINKAFYKSINSSNKNNKEIIDYLISINADINYVDERTGKNILIKAIETNNLNLVKLLVSKKSNVNFISIYGYTPLMAAINNLKILKYLFVNNARINLYNPRYRQNLLSYAISMGNNNNEVIKFLISKNANTKNALYNASIKFNAEIVKALLKKGVKKNKKYKGDTPLTGAIKYAVNNIKYFDRNQLIKKTISLLISKNIKLNDIYLKSINIKPYKKLYNFIKKEQKRYNK